MNWSCDVHRSQDKNGLHPDSLYIRKLVTKFTDLYLIATSGLGVTEVKCKEKVKIDHPEWRHSLWLRGLRTIFRPTEPSHRPDFKVLRYNWSKNTIHCKIVTSYKKAQTREQSSFGDQESQFAWSILCADALLGFHNILKSVLWMLTCDHVMILWLGPNFTICDTEEGADNTKWSRCTGARHGGEIGNKSAVVELVIGCANLWRASVTFSTSSSYSSKSKSKFASHKNREGLLGNTYIQIQKDNAQKNSTHNPCKH